MARYTVYAPFAGVPPPIFAGSALTPPMHRPAGAWSSRGRIFGQPGTMAIAAPPPSLPDGGKVAQAQSSEQSRNTPNVIFPSLYYEADWPKEHAPVSRVSDNQIPVPAKRAPNIIKASPYKTRKGGDRQIYQPQVIQRWLGQRGTPYG